MFYKSVMDAAGKPVADAKGNNVQVIDPTSVGVAIGLLLLILVGAFVANYLNFSSATGPLITSFIAGAGGIFGAILGDSPNT